MLSGLPLRIKRTGNLGSTEGAVRKLAAIFTGKGNALGNTLIDDVSAYLGKTIDIGFAGAEVSTLDRVVEESPNAVTIVLVVLGGIDTPLSGDRMGAAGAVMETECLHLITELGKCGGSGGAGKSGPHHDDLELPFVRGADQLRVVLEVGPLLVDGTLGNFGIKNHRFGKIIQ